MKLSGPASLFTLLLTCACLAQDRVVLKDGSIIIGEVVQMTGGVLRMKTLFGPAEIVEVKWSEVSDLKTERPLPFVLADGTIIFGQSEGGEVGSAVLRAVPLPAPAVVELAAITAINPPPVKPVVFKGGFHFGGSVTDGNTNNRNASFAGEIEARSAKHRVTVRGAWNYADSSIAGLTARNTKGSIKYDFFVTRRLFVYVSALAEQDTFQDLNLRTALSIGPGYQIITRGDFEEPFLSGLELYGEAGIAYFNEDFRTSQDRRYASARWAAKLNWPLLPRLALFHNHEGYPGLERARDLYITTEQGVRVSIWEGFVASAQVNWRWDNTPAPGFERSDTLYLMTVGYNFEF
jgi:putative salt-induced outer membrane protein YdiY